jgi:hypothetical protein
MRRNLLCMTVLVLSMVLTACGSSTNPPATNPASSGDTAASQGTLSPAAKDLLGIFKLEDTDLAVDATQAATLLPLWQAYRSLLNSDTTASAELEAVKIQIDEAITAKQTAAIAAMNLTAQDMISMAEQLGVSQTVASTSDGTDSGSTRPGVVGAGTGAAAGGGAPPSGDGSMSAPPSDGAGGPPAGDTGVVDPFMMVSSTSQAGQSITRSQGDILIQALLDPLIELLKQRAVA